MGVSGIPVKPPLPPGRRRRPSRVSRRSTLTHIEWRKLGHLYGYIDPQRTWRARIAISKLWRPFFGIFGDPTILLRYAPLIHGTRH